MKVKCKMLSQSNCSGLKTAVNYITTQLWHQNININNACVYKKVKVSLQYVMQAYRKGRSVIFIYCIYKKGSHPYLLIQITIKYQNPHTINENSPPFLINKTIFLHRHRKLKQLPFKCQSHHGESTLTIHRTPHPPKGHHQISMADLPANMQSNCITMLNYQYVKYHIRILS